MGHPRGIVLASPLRKLSLLVLLQDIPDAQLALLVGLSTVAIRSYRGRLLAGQELSAPLHRCSRCHQEAWTLRSVERIFGFRALASKRRGSYRAAQPWCRTCRGNASSCRRRERKMDMAEGEPGREKREEA